MIDVKQAVGAAMKYARDIIGPDQAPTLEEVEMTPDERYWLITLGFDPRLSPFEVLGGTRPQRDYKIFRIDAETGKVLSMKIRTVE
ncbi:MAG TPA: hypothetical protein VF746_03070 [Longimicrobium sp.]